MGKCLKCTEFVKYFKAFDRGPKHLYNAHATYRVRKPHPHRARYVALTTLKELISNGMLDRHDEVESDIEFENNDSPQEVEIEDAEAQVGDKIKILKTKLKECEAEKMSHLEELQRAKADFLNARNRLEENRIKDRQRSTVNFIDELLPLCDSFHMAMDNEEVWNNVDEVWRKGVESIFSQLNNILENHQVKSLDPTGEDFDPNLHEALSNEPVDNEEQHHKVIKVIQPGYTITVGEKTEVIRPARVVVGEFNNN